MQGPRPSSRRRFLLLSVGLVLALGLVWLVCSRLVLDHPSTDAPAIAVEPRDQPTSPGQAAPALRFEVDEGDLHNAFFRQGPVAAHLVLRSGERPRIIAAFPAGNSGVGLWFAPGEALVALTQIGPLLPVLLTDGLRGVTAEIEVDAARLEVERALLGSVRVLRDHMHGGEVPAAVETAPEIEGRAVWSRARLDGQPGYRLELEPLQGARVRLDRQRVVLEAAAGTTSLRCAVTALTGEAPLHPLSIERLLKPGADADQRARDALAFLAYEEKLLAGSWRFLTYFGRDTLLSVRLLMPVLQPDAIEAALGSVFERLSARGEVAHEEDIGEFALLRHRAEGGEAERTAPIYDYKMVDDDFMLAPVLAHYLLDTVEGRARARAFLARRRSGGGTYAEALTKNLSLVLEQARPFASSPTVAHLIALKPGEPVGEWRDSMEGLGEGRIPYNVNAALVPAALEAVRRLLEAQLVDLDGLDAGGVAQLAQAWQQAPGLFDVRLDRAQAQARAQAYAAGLDLPAPAPDAFGTEGLRFPAVALRADGSAVEVMHSDDGFVLLFTEPAPTALEDIAWRVAQPFPAGLLTPVGMLVANPAYAGDEVAALFTRKHYHGTVVWSWQQALMAEGLRRQLTRADLPGPTRAALALAQQALWKVIQSTRGMSGSELWAWEQVAGRYQVLPFGAESGAQTESNAAQLWSTVFLAVQPVSPPRPPAGSTSSVLR